MEAAGSQDKHPKSEELSQKTLFQSTDWVDYQALDIVDRDNDRCILSVINEINRREYSSHEVGITD